MSKRDADSSDDMTAYLASEDDLAELRESSRAFASAMERNGREDFVEAEASSARIIEVPLPEEKIEEFEAFCRRVVGYKLDDFPPGSCKRGVRRESQARVLGPFTIRGKRVFNTQAGTAYALVQCDDGRYISDSTKEKATACIGRGEIHGTPEGSWSVIVRKGLGVPDERASQAQRDANDDFGRHAQIAALSMCHQIVNYIYDHMT